MLVVRWPETPHQATGGQRHRTATNTECLVIEDIILSTGVDGPATRDTALMEIVGSPVVGATILTASSNDLVVEPLAPVASVLSHQFWWST